VTVTRFVMRRRLTVGARSVDSSWLPASC
jgi:hypothetical protein